MSGDDGVYKGVGGRLDIELCKGVEMAFECLLETLISETSEFVEILLLYALSRRDPPSFGNSCTLAEVVIELADSGRRGISVISGDAMIRSDKLLMGEFSTIDMHSMSLLLSF